MKKILPFFIFILLVSGCGHQANTPATMYSNDDKPVEENPIDESYFRDDKTFYPPTTQPKTDTTMNLEIDQNKLYTAVLHTSEGDIEVALNAKATPITVNNFVTLAKKDFYNGTIFHRVIEGFMIQGGDPTGTGSGGPGYKFADEPFEGEYTRGTVAMANAGPNTNGSQFFIMHEAQSLRKDYVIFGKVTKGMDVVDKIATAPVDPRGEGSRPITPVKVNSVDISEK